MDTWLGDSLAGLSPWPRHVRPRAPRCSRRLESGEASAALALAEHLEQLSPSPPLALVQFLPVSSLRPGHVTWSWVLRVL